MASYIPNDVAAKKALSKKPKVKPVVSSQKKLAKHLKE